MGQVCTRFPVICLQPTARVTSRYLFSPTGNCRNYGQKQVPVLDTALPALTALPESCEIWCFSVGSLTQRTSGENSASDEKVWKHIHQYGAKQNPDELH